MEFRTQYERIRYISNPGSQFKEIYVLDPNGNNEFDIMLSDKKYNLQEYIDSFKDQCDVNILIKRFENGDITALGDPSQFVGGDIYGFPDSIQDIYKLNKSAKEYFNSLPADIKSCFNDINDFYTSDPAKISKVYGDFYDKLKEINKKNTTPSE